MDDSIESLAEWVDAALASADPVPDILQRAPALSAHAAYRVQCAVMDRRVAGGDRLIGYKAALTSQAMQEETGIAEPLVGTLLGSCLIPEGEPVSLSAKGFIRATLEPEIAVLLKSDLSGPGVTRLDVLAATEGYLPAIELGDYRSAITAGGVQNVVVCNTYNGGIVIGGPLCSPDGLDLRVEGVVLNHNGRSVASATGVEVLGDPLSSVAFMANKLSELDRSLQAGMVLMTGSITRSIPLAAGDDVSVSFTRLGTVQVRLVA